MSVELLERKEYLVGITIIEARNIQGKDAAGTSDPFIVVKCAGQVQQTQKKYEVNSAVWNQTLTFSGIKMNQYELETFEMNIECFDHNALLANELIGQYSIGLSTLYRNTNHEFYKVWISLFDRENPNKVQGYLLISCFIVGPNERPPVHSQDEDFDPDGQDDSDEDEDEIARKIENIRRAQGMTQVVNPNTIVKKYQLTVIVTKAEQLPFCEADKKIRPFVSARVFGSVLTTVAKMNISPNFNAKLQYPIFYPILNDKITMRIWHKNSGMSPNLFIANIPEHPSAADNFNISKLLSQDGRMSARWINLYGTHPLERSSKTKGKKEGSTWLGRVLIAFNIVSNERPQLMSQQSNPVKTPKNGLFQIWVDLYTLVSCELVSPGDPIWVVISCGEKKSEAQHFKFKKKKNCYKFKNIQVEKLVDIQMPADLNQIADIFLNFYTNSAFSDQERIAYLRLKAKDCLSVKPKPSWYRLKSPYNDTGGASPGLLLANIQFLRYEPPETQHLYNPERVLKNKDGKIQYRFYYHIYQGFELATVIPASKLKTRVEIRIGSLAIDKNEVLETKNCSGRYPVWDVFGTEMVQLEKELTFESDMKITLINKKSKLFGGFSNQIIGEFAVPVDSLLDRCDKPQFYNVLNEEGQFMGQILANFYLKKYYRDPKTRKIKDWVDVPHQNTIKEFKEATETDYTVHVDFALLGLRNLIFQAVQPKVYIELSNDPDSLQIIQIDENFKKDTGLEETNNPNLGKVIRFENVQLAREPLYWPYIVVRVEDEVKEKALIHSFSGCESCFTTISLIDYGEDLLKEQEFQYAQAQLRRNQDQLIYIQKQVPIKAFLKSIGIETVNFNTLTAGQGGGADKNMPMGEGAGGLRPSMVGGMMLNELAQGAGGAQGRLQGTVDLFRALDQNFYDDNEVLNISEIAEEQKEEMNDMKFDIGEGAAGSDNNDDDFLNGGGGKETQANDLDNGVIVDLNQVVDLYIGKQNKALEEKERQSKISECAAIIKGLMRKIKNCKEDEQVSKNKLRIRMMEVTEEMEDLMEEAMTEEKFWGMLALDDDVVAFDYGRDILKEGTYETQMRLPYEQMPLFTQQDWFQGEQKPILQVSGILRSGNPSGASIKGKIQLVLIDEEGDDSDEEEDENEDKQLLKDKKGKGATNEGPEPSNKAEFILNLCTEISDTHPFDMFKKEYMKRLNDDRQSFKIRLYLITAQNLTATGTAIDLKSKLAGMTALSTANPYPVILVGDGKNVNVEGGKSILKMINEREEAIENDLNPKLFRTYEFDALLPEDWKMEVGIYDRGFVALADQLIGSTQIDLENRLYSNLLYINKHSIEIEFEKAKEAYQTFKPRKHNLADTRKKRKLKSKMEDLRDKARQLKNIEQFLVPVEYRELIHPAKAQAQGIVEMWTEVLTLDEAPKIPWQKMEVIKKEIFEIRLIVWETREVPLVDGDKVDIFVKVTWDPTGWPEDELTKQTDIHHNSKTGWGVFNWRFKFQLEVPCDFPRIKFNIHDGGLITDEAIGEATLNLKRTINKVIKEGFVEVPKTYISFTHPNKPGEERGILMFSMTILTKEDAESEPVGEAHDEPNENPFLKKPTVGRGLGDALAGIKLNVDLDFSWNPFGKFLYFVIAIFILSMLIAAGMMLK